MGCTDSSVWMDVGGVGGKRVARRGGEETPRALIF